VCPHLHTTELRQNQATEPECYAAIHRNMRIRYDSTSGGIFTALAQEAYDRGGVVGGAVYNSDFSVRQIISTTPDDLPELRNSKYQQSDARGFHKQALAALKEGKWMLACGTPCQMGALRRVAGKLGEKLVTAEFICNSVASPKVYQRYIHDLEESHHSKIKKIKVKSKDLGWRSIVRKVSFENGEKYYGFLGEDGSRGWLKHHFYCRPSCHECPFKGFPRVADITIGDFWGFEKFPKLKNLDNDVGTSLVILNSEKGKAFFESVKPKLEWAQIPFSSLPANGALMTSLPPSDSDREEFFNFLDTHSFQETLEKYFPLDRLSLKQKLKAKAMPFLRFAKRIWKLGSIKSLCQFIWINFLRKNTVRSKGHYFFPYAHSVLDIHPSAKIILENTIHFGGKSFKGSRQQSCLLMRAGTTLEFHESPRNRCGKEYAIFEGAEIEIVNGGTLRFGNGYSNRNLSIMCASDVSFGDGTVIGRNVTVRDWNGAHIIVADSYRTHAPVHMGDHCWIASGAHILAGVTVNDDSVVGAHSVVSKDVPPKAVVAGNPAKVVREDMEWY
jgi:coenzyme F420-reducing hydrogenase beta subunit